MDEHQKISFHIIYLDKTLDWFKYFILIIFFSYLPTKLNVSTIPLINKSAIDRLKISMLVGFLSSLVVIMAPKMRRLPDVKKVCLIIIK